MGIALESKAQALANIIDSAGESLAKTAQKKHTAVGLDAAFSSLNLQEQNQWSFSTGVLGVRQYAVNKAFDFSARSFDSPYAACNLHTHANYKNQPGFGELALMINGRYVRMRHQDYRMARSVISTNAEENAFEHISAPTMPAAVLALPTGISGAIVDFASDTQAKYVKEQFTTNKADVELWLAYAEIWYEKDDGTVPSEGSSYRHAEIEDSNTEAYKKQSEYYASGQKDKLENRSTSPVEALGYDDDGAVIYGVPHARILCKKIGNMANRDEVNRVAPYTNIGIGSGHGHVVDRQLTDQESRDLVSGVLSEVVVTSSDNNHAHTYTITYSGGKFVGVSAGAHAHEVLIDGALTGNYPFEKDKAVDGIYDYYNRFKLVRDLRTKNIAGSFEALIDSDLARFEVSNLDRICELVPGLDGEGASLVEFNESYSTDNVLDRDGGQLNAAYYSNQHASATNDAGGRSVTLRGFNDSNLYSAMTQNPKVLNGRSYMIPIEIVALPPHWNPLNVADVDKSTLDAESNAGAGSSNANPLSGSNDNSYLYHTPTGLYADGGSSDPADTGRTAWIEDENGVAHQCYGSGVWWMTPDGAHRRRFPIYPLAQQFSYESIHIEHLKTELKTILKDIVAGNATAQDIEDLM